MPFFRTSKLFAETSVDKEINKSVEDFLTKKYPAENDSINDKWAVRSSGNFLILFSFYILFFYC